MNLLRYEHLEDTVKAALRTSKICATANKKEKNEKTKGLTIVPLSVYNSGRKIKLNIHNSKRSLQTCQRKSALFLNNS